MRQRNRASASSLTNDHLPYFATCSITTRRDQTTLLKDLVSLNTTVWIAVPQNSL